MEFVN